MININEPAKQTQKMEDANEIQRQLAKQNRLMVVLTVFLVFLSIITFLSYYNKTGRYAISTTGEVDAAHVLDTKTSQLYIRTKSGNLYLGTNKNPESSIIECKQE